MDFVILRSRIAYKQFTNQELNKEEKLYIIRKNLGMSSEQFKSLDDEEIEEFVRLELWKNDLCKEYKKKKEAEEKEKLMNSGRYKQYKRYMKRNAGNTISFLEE